MVMLDVWEVSVKFGGEVLRVCLFGRGAEAGFVLLGLCCILEEELDW